jgi:quercetin dioxygenase-like cupin family protein
LGFSQEKPEFSPKTRLPASANVALCRYQKFSCGDRGEEFMMTQNDPATTLQSVPVEQHQVENVQPGSSSAAKRRAQSVWWGLGAAALAAVLAYAQVAPLQIIPLAQGSNLDHNTVLHLKGPTDILQTDLIFQPGGTTGWHIHPGPVVVIVKSGALTEIQTNGCMTVHPAGSGFFEDANDVHNVINETSEVTEVYATFLSPAGAQPLIPVADPGVACSK